ncbi:MAG: hypothetical protein AVDCRST_MAG89-1176, partial [uncultured Gemmatimonadetes bacterium]
DRADPFRRAARPPGRRPHRRARAAAPRPRLPVRHRRRPPLAAAVPPGKPGGGQLARRAGVHHPGAAGGGGAHHPALRGRLLLRQRPAAAHRPSQLRHLWRGGAGAGGARHRRGRGGCRRHRARVDGVPGAGEHRAGGRRPLRRLPGAAGAHLGGAPVGGARPRKRARPARRRGAAHGQARLRADGGGGARGDDGAADGAGGEPSPREARRAVHRGPGAEQRGQHHGAHQPARLRRVHLHPLGERVHLFRRAGQEAGVPQEPAVRAGAGRAAARRGQGAHAAGADQQGRAADGSRVRRAQGAPGRGADAPVRHARPGRAAPARHAHGVRAPHEGGPDRLPALHPPAQPHRVQPHRGHRRRLRRGHHQAELPGPAVAGGKGAAGDARQPGAGLRPAAGQGVHQHDGHLPRGQRRHSRHLRAGAGDGPQPPARGASPAHRAGGVRRVRGAGGPAPHVRPFGAGPRDGQAAAHHHQDHRPGAVRNPCRRLLRL